MAAVSPDAALTEYLRNGQQGLDDLLAAMEGGFEAVEGPGPGGGRLTKVVLARRTDVQLAGALDALALLEALHDDGTLRIDAFVSRVAPPPPGAERSGHG